MSQYTVFLMLAPPAAMVCMGVIVYAWRTRASRETQALMWLLFSIVGWLICNLFELAAATETFTVLWAKFSYIPVTSTGVIWLLFAVQYTGQDHWVTTKRFAWFWLLPGITNVLVLTNELHGLLWREYAFSPVNNLLALHVVHGPWFWVNAIYEYSLVIFGTALILRQAFTSYRLYQQQSIWLAVGAIVPIAANAIYIFRLIPGLTLDFTAISFALAGIAFVFGMFHHQLFDVQPVARDAVIDSMNDAMFALDLQDRVVDLNPAAQRLIGQDAKAILGQSAELLFGRWQTLNEQSHLTADVQTDCALEGHGGVVRHYDLRTSSLTNRRGQKTGRLIVLRDITGRKAAEVALHERTAELEVRNEQLDTFARTVAHDIKDPLTAIVGYSGILSEFAGTLSPEDQRRYLEMIINTSTKLANIVDALLLLASVHRLDEYETFSFDMGSVVAEAQERLAYFIQTQQATVVAAETWPFVDSYAPWVEEIWVNYLSNAIKYGGDPDASIPAHVELGVDAPREDRIRFWVKDNGPGLTEEQQAQLFNQFTRLRGSPSEGHGLGLSIVRNIARKLGGEAGVESEIGQGSRFWFTLPIMLEEKGG